MRLSEKLTGARDDARARRDLAAAGYRGEPVVVLGVAGAGYIPALSQAGTDVLRRIGMTIDMVVTDYATMARRIQRREAPEKGGWNAASPSSSSRCSVSRAARRRRLLRRPVNLRRPTGAAARRAGRPAPVWRRCGRRGSTPSMSKTRRPPPWKCNASYGSMCPTSRLGNGCASPPIARRCTTSAGVFRPSGACGMTGEQAGRRKASGDFDIGEV